MHSQSSPVLLLLPHQALVMPFEAHYVHLRAPEVQNPMLFAAGGRYLRTEDMH